MATMAKINNRNEKGIAAHNAMARGNPIRSRQNCIKISHSSQRQYKNKKHDRNEKTNKRNEIGHENTQKRKQQTAASTSIREQFLRTNLDVLLIGIFLAVYNNHQVDAAADSRVGAFASLTGHYLGSDNDGNFVAVPEDFSNGGDNTQHGNGGNESENYSTASTYAILFPWFTQLMGVFIYYLLSRHIPSLPYAAIVFLLGFSIGYTTTSTSRDATTQSASIWLQINGQLILLIFLPGLIFLDSITTNVFLFFQAFWQLVTFAFPMVMGGTFLTALVAMYVFPYGWSFNLCMTFGAILSGTDPVAVSGILNALGAPPRLKMHISGESLLNDGSAVVFYNIFSSRFYNELGVPGFGSDIGWGEGFLLFLRLCFGGVAIGLAFGMGTVFMLYLLRRRLSSEENVMQVVTTICSAYLTYFVADTLSQCSGIVAVLVCGIIVRVFGETMVNDLLLTFHFWEVAGQCLNTLLFVLGGCLWGNIISDNRFSGEEEGLFTATDWGYLFILFFCLIVIRFILVFSFYPITARLGIGTSIKEAVFMSYGGLRGAVGIALALTLNATIYDQTDGSDETHLEYMKFRDDTARLFGMSGGISLLTLLVNGVTAGPLLRWLRLVTPKIARMKVIQNYKHQMVQNALLSYVELLSQERFKDLDYSVIREHIPFLRDISRDRLMAAVRRVQDTKHSVTAPRLDHILPYFYEGDEGSIIDERGAAELDTQVNVKGKRRSTMAELKESINYENVFDHIQNVEDNIVNEERLNFIEILRSAYHQQIENGELESHGELQYSLFQSLNFAEDAAGKGLPLNDWYATQVASDCWVSFADKAFNAFLRRLRHLQCKKACCWKRVDLEFLAVKLQVRQVLAFVRAHRVAQMIFKQDFAAEVLTAAEETVLEESNAQIKLAEASLEKLDRSDIHVVVSHFACHILLNKSVHFVEQLAKQNLIQETEASAMLVELDEYIEHLLDCDKISHEDVMSRSKQSSILQQMAASSIFSETFEEEGNDLSAPLMP